MCQRKSTHWPGARDFSCGFPVSARRLAGAGRAFNSNQVPLKGKHSKRRTWSLSLRKKKNSIRMSAITHISVNYPPRHAALCSQPPASHLAWWKPKPPTRLEREKPSPMPARSPRAWAGQNPKVRMGNADITRGPANPQPSLLQTSCSTNPILAKRCHE